MIPDLWQYFLDEFWNFPNSPNIDQVWTCGPRIYYQNTIKNTRKLWEHQAWVYGLRWRPVCCIFFLSDFLGFRHATAFSFLVFLDSGMSLHFILCFVLRLFRFFQIEREFAFIWLFNIMVVVYAFHNSRRRRCYSVKDHRITHAVTAYRSRGNRVYLTR